MIFPGSYKEYSAFIRSVGGQGNINEAAFEWLGSLGYTGQLNERWNKFLSDNGYTSPVLQEKGDQYAEDGYGGGAAVFSNLDAESGDNSGWTTDSGAQDLGVVTDPNTGTYAFTSGTSGAVVSRAYQTATVESVGGDTAYIDSGDGYIRCDWWAKATTRTSVRQNCWVDFYDASNVFISSGKVGNLMGSDATYNKRGHGWVAVPVGTRFIRLYQEHDASTGTLVSPSAINSRIDGIEVEIKALESTSVTMNNAGGEVNNLGWWGGFVFRANVVCTDYLGTQFFAIGGGTSSGRTDGQIMVLSDPGGWFDSIDAGEVWATFDVLTALRQGPQSRINFNMYPRTAAGADIGTVRPVVPVHSTEIQGVAMTRKAGAPYIMPANMREIAVNVVDNTNHASGGYTGFDDLRLTFWREIDT